MAKKLKAGLLQRMMSVTLGRIEIALQRESPSLAEVLAAASDYIASTNEKHFLPSDLNIDRIGLRDQTEDVLRVNGIVNLGALLSSTPGDLCRLDGFYPSMLEDVRHTLLEKNLHLKGDKELNGATVLRALQAKANG
jgi:DNA-directed RNA polymerase alpha subunit